MSSSYQSNLGKIIGITISGPPPQMIPIDFQPQPEPLTCHSLPPKKKLAMRRAEETEEQRVAPAEIITID